MNIIFNILKTYLKLKVFNNVFGFYENKFKSYGFIEFKSFLINISYIIYSPILFITFLISLIIGFNIELNGGDPTISYSLSFISLITFAILLIKSIGYFKRKTTTVNQIHEVINNPIDIFVNKILIELYSEQKEMKDNLID